MTHFISCTMPRVACLLQSATTTVRSKPEALLCRLHASFSVLSRCLLLLLCFGVYLVFSSLYLSLSSFCSLSLTDLSFSISFSVFLSLFSVSLSYHTTYLSLSLSFLLLYLRSLPNAQFFFFLLTFFLPIPLNLSSLSTLIYAIIASSGPPSSWLLTHSPLLPSVSIHYSRPPFRRQTLSAVARWQIVWCR